MEKQEKQKTASLNRGKTMRQNIYFKKFAEEHFDNYVYINLEREPQIAEVFNYGYDTKRILEDIINLKLLPDFIPTETLLLIDEIQINPKAITALKYFQEEMPELAIVGAGSLLGVSIRKKVHHFLSVRSID